MVYNLGTTEPTDKTKYIGGILHRGWRTNYCENGVWTSRIVEWLPEDRRLQADWRLVEAPEGDRLQYYQEPA